MLSLGENAGWLMKAHQAQTPGDEEDYAWEKVQRECKRLQGIIIEAIGNRATSSSTNSSSPPSFSEEEYERLALYFADMKAGGSLMGSTALMRLKDLTRSFVERLAVLTEGLTGAVYFSALHANWERFKIYRMIVTELMNTMYYSESYIYFADKEFSTAMLEGERLITEFLEFVNDCRQSYAPQSHEELAAFSAVNLMFLVFTEVGVKAKEYVTHFEVPLLAQRKSFYGQSFQELWKTEPSLVSYFYKAKEFSQYELTLPVLDHSKKEMEIILLEESVLNKRDAIIDRLLEEWQSIMDRKDVPELQALYYWLSKIPLTSYPVLIKLFHEHVSGEALAILKELLDAENSADSKSDAPTALKHVARLSDLYHLYSKLITDAFAEDAKLSVSLESAFQEVTGKIECKQPKLEQHLAAITHMLLTRGGGKMFDDEELEKNLDATALVYRYSHNKDVFLELYTRSTGRRLILDVSASHDRERSMLSKIKEVSIRYGVGAQALHAAEQMLRGVSESAALTARFNKVNPLKIDSSVIVLSSACWKQAPLLVPLSLPQEFLEFQNAFQLFYKQIEPTQKLTWMHQMCTCNLTAHFKRGTKELGVSLTQAMILLLFNDTSRWTLGDVTKYTKMDKAYIKVLVKDFVSKKILLVKAKEGEEEGKSGAEMTEATALMVNDNFRNKRFRLKLNGAQTKITQAEQGKTVAEVLDNRKYVVQAAVVAVMKARKRLAHSELVRETLSRLTFPYEVTDLKRVLEGLIDKQYLERQSSYYVYIP